MAGDDELEARVTALEADVQALRQDVADVRTLAVGADGDVSAFAARLDTHQRLLQALRETQIEQGVQIEALKRRLDAVEAKLSSLETEMRSGFAMLAAGQAQIVTMLERLAAAG
jgi:chromosome segregation ATPase